MARYAKVDVRIWDDEKVSGMTPIPPCGQGLWIRLLVSRHRSAIPGLLCVGEAALAEEFGWSLKAFREAFWEAQSRGLVKANWAARVVWIPKAWKYNPPESANVVKSWRVPWDETPECDLKREAHQALKAFLEGFGEGFRLAFAKSCGEASAKAMANQDPDPEQEQEQEQTPKAPKGARIRSEYSEAFESAWKLYVRGEDKAGAFREWRRAAQTLVGGEQELLERITVALTWQIPTWKATDREFPKHQVYFVRYLSHKRWEDEKPQPSLFARSPVAQAQRLPLPKIAPVTPATARGWPSTEKPSPEVQTLIAGIAEKVTVT